MKASVGSRVLMLLENNPYQFDIRPKREAQSLVRAGYRVTVICPRLPGHKFHEIVDCVHLFQFPAPPAATGFLGYLWEYGYSLVATFVLSLIVFFREGFDVIHAHNPPDIFFSIAACYKLFGKSFVYDHHDLAPEMYHARFGDSSPIPDTDHSPVGRLINDDQILSDIYILPDRVSTPSQHSRTESVDWHMLDQQL